MRCLKFERASFIWLSSDQFLDDDPNRLPSMFFITVPETAAIQRDIISRVMLLVIRISVFQLNNEFLLLRS